MFALIGLLLVPCLTIESQYGDYRALALTAITAHPNTPVPIIDEDNWKVIQAAFWKTSIDLELMDERECTYIFNDFSTFDHGVDILRKRNQDLMGAPLVGDSKRFPRRDHCGEMIAFNRAFRSHVNNKMLLETDRRGLYQEIISETDYLFRVWEAISESGAEFYYIQTRRLALKRLKDLIGAESYYTGNLPPYVPFWRFQEER